MSSYLDEKVVRKDDDLGKKQSETSTMSLLLPRDIFRTTIDRQYSPRQSIKSQKTGVIILEQSLPFPSPNTSPTGSIKPFQHRKLTDKSEFTLTPPLVSSHKRSMLTNQSFGINSPLIAQQIPNDSQTATVHSFPQQKIRTTQGIDQKSLEKTPDFRSSKIKHISRTRQSSSDKNSEISSRKHSFIVTNKDSLWKKYTLHGILKMADRRIVDDQTHMKYHMFMSGKMKKGSILEYNDDVNKKFIDKESHENIASIDYRDVRRDYKRVLQTIGMRKVAQHTNDIDDQMKISTSSESIERSTVQSTITSTSALTSVNNIKTKQKRQKQQLPKRDEDKLKIKRKTRQKISQPIVLNMTPGRLSTFDYKNGPLLTSISYTNDDQCLTIFKTAPTSTDDMVIQKRTKSIRDTVSDVPDLDFSPASTASEESYDADKQFFLKKLYFTQM
ncbi:unnamed protein product [Didymodactylos carnosus]|uniref:Uncharacterized protein n=1 Tax=Didymodactylos carnosus TaxID=1234261 RepID=A0A8S2JBZ9_9BILA|nr:unnamed protein product [Didymodactylos carnosus]CAF3804035.1 unnamed protein product [Didymodactylos carnosus]